MSRLVSASRPVRAVVSSTLALVLVGAAATAATALTLGSWSPGPAAAVQPPIAELAIVKGEPTPAETALNSALSKLPWKSTGNRKLTSAPPFPFSCPQRGTTPAIARAQDYTAGGDRVTVTLTAYTAGLGAEAMSALRNGIRNCQLDTDRVGVSEYSIGAEAVGATVSRGSTRAAVLMVRRGDVIGYVSAPTLGSATANARTLDERLAAALDGVCADQSSGTDAATRNPRSTAGYTPFLRSVDVAVENPGLPALPDDADYESVSLGTELPALSEAKPMVEPDFPVWPEMPAAQPVPEPLKVPAVSATTEGSVAVPADDASGPGCGWAFTSGTAPQFDAKAAKKVQLERVAVKEKSLTDAADQWQESVLAFWKAYPGYVEAVQKYGEYATQVEQTNAAWTAIAGQWDTYKAEKDDYERLVKERDAFLAEQAAAQREYDTALEECLADTAPPTSTPTPGPTPSPDPTETSNCDIPRPGILDETAAEVPDEPAPPADPRP